MGLAEEDNAYQTKSYWPALFGFNKVVFQNEVFSKTSVFKPHSTTGKAREKPAQIEIMV